MSTQRFNSPSRAEGNNPYLQLFTVLVQLEQEREDLERLSRQLNRAKGTSQGPGVHLRGLRSSSLMKGLGSIGSPNRAKSLRGSDRQGFYASDKLECDEIKWLASQCERKAKVVKALEEQSQTLREEIRRSLMVSD